MLGSFEEDSESESGRALPEVVQKRRTHSSSSSSSSHHRQVLLRPSWCQGPSRGRFEVVGRSTMGSSEDKEQLVNLKKRLDGKVAIVTGALRVQGLPAMRVAL